MKVRITKAEKETYWYAKHIGEEFEVKSESDKKYRVVSKWNIMGRLINISDCEVITEPIKLPMNKGSKRYLKSDPKHCYIKQDDNYFGWWRLENESREPKDRMMVRMTDDDALSEPWFIVEPKPKLHEPLTADPTGDSDMNYSDERCPKCGSRDLIDTDDHYTQCRICGFSFVG